MKVVEIRNMCISYDRRVCAQAADWAGLYIIKQILRNIQIKMLKNSINEAELWVPESIVKTIDKWTKNKSNKNNNKSKSGGSGGGSGGSKGKKRKP